MSNITRTKSETVATVSSGSRKITVKVTDSLTIEESRELRKLLKAEEVLAHRQRTGTVYGFDPITGAFNFNIGNRWVY